MKTTRTALIVSAWLVVSGLAQAAEPVEITVYKSPTCGCCEKWISHLEANGFKVTPQNMNDTGMVKAMSGIRPETASCHTGIVNGYVIEGHVPATDVKRFLAEKPDALGLSAPGMPQGSPGMEQGGQHDNYRVLLLKKDGSTEVYAEHGPAFD